MNSQLINELIHETSPYLLQHAQNPVHWQIWSEATLATAKQLDKPIILSIGYSACHWCHVMEKESFEDDAIAAYMNEHFISIKVDREERPDLDHIYMEAVQVLIGSGGWPLNVFLTPNGEPFFGGTYFPPKRMHNRTSWLETLQVIHDLWINKREEVDLQANKLTVHIKSTNEIFSTRINKLTNVSPSFNEEYFKNISNQLLKSADYENGGFGNAPKFPQLLSIQYLLHYHHHCKDTAALNHALHSLKALLNGGIYDHLAGGLARYSTDEKWHAPHFEKMLYDNALFITVMCDAFQITQDKVFSDGIDKTISFCVNELKSREGGYYTAIDADSEGEEGKYYVWDKSAIEKILQKDAEIFCDYYDVKEEGNWEATNILHGKINTNDFLKKFTISGVDLLELLNECQLKLLKHRVVRKRPTTDTKILLGINAMLITAYCKAYGALQNPAYRSLAIELFNFIKTTFSKDKKFYFHSYSGKTAKQNAYLDDLAFVIQACINLQEITGDQQYLYEAKSITHQVKEDFEMELTGLFYYTNKNQKDLLLRKVDVYDNTSASGNSTMAENLRYLSVIFNHNEWLEQSENMVQKIEKIAHKHPISLSNWCLVLLNNSIGLMDIVITGKDAFINITQVLGNFLPNKVLQSSVVEMDLPLLKHKKYDKNVLFYICKNNTCRELSNEFVAF